MSHHRAGQGQLLLLWVAVATAASLSGHVAQHEDGARGTCDFRLAESTRYSHWISPLGALGVSANTTLNVNGEDLGSGPYRGVCVSPPTFGSHAERWTGHNVSLEDFLAQDAATVRKLISQNVLPVVHGGASTTSLLVIDIEEPARPDGFHALNHSTLVRVVDALRLRVAALKHAMPRCSVSFYGAPTRLHIATAINGYQRASALGLFDDVEYSTPSLYLSPGQDPENVTQDVLQCAERGILRSNGAPVPLAPFLSWVYEGRKGGPDYHCALSAETMRRQLALLLQAGNVRVPIIAWFNGMDNKTDMCGGFRDQLMWMQQNDFVPSRCKSIIE